MSETTLATATPARLDRPVAPMAHAPVKAPDRLDPLRRLVARASNEWLPRAVWTLGRTGRTGLVGVVLIAASLIFVASTQLKMADEVTGLKADLVAARTKGTATHRDPADAAQATIRDLPDRIAMPALLGTLLTQAADAHLSIDTGKYEVAATKAGQIVRYKVSFPVTGPYPQIREFIDSTLKELPSAAISELTIQRKSIADAAVEAEVRLVVFTRGAP